MNLQQKSKTPKWLSGLVIVFSIFTLGGCAGHSLFSRYPLLSDGVAQVPPHDYIIGPGDNVQITVWRNPEISSSVPVRPDGKITAPLVEDMPASGKTGTQLAREMEKVLAKYVQDPIVTVTVTGFIGPYSEQIRVIGQAAKPQALPYRENMTILDVMIVVGGITDFAAGNSASVLRVVDGKPQQFGVRLKDLIKKGDVSANAAMRPGDVLIIPESFF